MKRIKNKKGITLVSLAVTIIVLFILLAVAVQTQIRGGAILTIAKDTSELALKKELQEKAKKNVVSYYTEIKKKIETEPGFEALSITAKEDRYVEKVKEVLGKTFIDLDEEKSRKYDLANITLEEITEEVLKFKINRTGSTTEYMSIDIPNMSPYAGMSKDKLW